MKIKIIKFFILVAHLSMLVWLVWLLKVGGNMLMNEVALHFIGLSLMGFLLIRGTSAIEMKWFRDSKRRK